MLFNKITNAALFNLKILSYIKTYIHTKLSDKRLKLNFLQLMHFFKRHFF